MFPLSLYLWWLWKWFDGVVRWGGKVGWLCGVVLEGGCVAWFWRVVVWSELVGLYVEVFIALWWL